MRFYYFSILSLIPLAVYYVLALAALAVLALVIKRLTKPRGVLFFSVALVLVVLPCTEEFWIAYHFDKYCRGDAGYFVYQTVEVEGFYDDAHGWRADKLRVSGYRWMEGRASDSSFWRHEWVGDEIHSRKIDSPTARYRYRTVSSHERVERKISRFEDVVVDSRSEEVLGRYVNYYRGAPWFFLALDTATISCDEPREGIREHGSLIYSAVLKPLR